MSKPADIETNPKPAGRWWAWLALLLIFGIHSFQAIRLFPSLRSIVDRDSPVVVVDHAIHEYHGALGARFCREAGTSWGFDPAFMAGYPETPVWDSSSNPSILFDLIGGTEDYRAYKVGLFASSILLLVAIAGGAWAAGQTTAEVAVATGLAWFSFWVGFPVTLWRSGLFAFVLASASVGLLLGLCVRFDFKATMAGWVALTVIGALLFFVHVTTPILAIGGLLAFLATVARRHGWRWHAAICGAGGLAVVANLPWLVSLWRFRSIRTGSGLFMTANSAWYLVEYFLQPSTEGRTALVLLVLGTAGLVAWWFTGRRGAAAAFGGSIVGLIVLTGFGSLWEPTRNLEPLRFRVGLLFLLAVPAGSAVVLGSGLIARWIGGRRRGAFGVGLLWILILGAWGWIEPTFFRRAGRGSPRIAPCWSGSSPRCG